MDSTQKETIRKVLNGSSSRENAGHVVDWFSSSIEGQQYLSELIDRDAYLCETEALPDISAAQSRALFSKISKTIHEKRLKITLWRVAAVLVPFIFVLGLALYLDAQTDLWGKAVYAEIHIPKGEKARVVFQDGSEAYLNSDTKIRYPKKFGWRKRHVYLQGEAYFSVAINKLRPFIVHTGHDTGVKVTGTSFNVNAYENSPKISVTLDEGKIAFSTPHNRYRVQPGQEFTYDRNTGEARILVLSESCTRSLWKDDVLYLHDTPLADVLRMLERRYNVAFDVKHPRALNYTFTITTKQLVVDSVLQELQKIAPLVFQKSGDKIAVSMSDFSRNAD